MEELPIDMLEPRVKSVTITELVDASHASDKRTKISYTGSVRDICKQVPNRIL